MQTILQPRIGRPTYTYVLLQVKEFGFRGVKFNNVAVCVNSGLSFLIRPHLLNHKIILSGHCEPCMRQRK